MNLGPWDYGDDALRVFPLPDRLAHDVHWGRSRAKRSHAEARRQWLISHGVAPRRHRVGFRARILAALAALFGPRSVLPAVVAAELGDLSRHGKQGDSAALAAEEVEEIDDAAVAAAVAEPGRQAAAGRRSASGNDLRAAVLGANDGLASNFCLMMGVAGGGDDGTRDAPHRAGRFSRRRVLDGPWRMAVGEQRTRTGDGAGLKTAR